MSEEGHATVRATLTVASWTTFSRLTGLARIIAIGAVLGPTYLGNTFQAINQMPNLVFQALTGSLLTMMLVPLLVPHVDTADRVEAKRVAGGFLGLAIVGFALLSLLALAAGPLLLRLLTLGVRNPAVASAQRHAGFILLVTVLPQIMLYAVAGTGEAVMNAHGKFALAAAAPGVENIGVTVVMVVDAIIFGTGTSVGNVRESQLLLLGLGSTAAVVLHATLQWWGAHRVGVTLIPRLGWRDPEVRGMARRMLPSAGYTGLNSLRMFGMLVVANLVPGGVVAFQLALNFLAFPVALGAWPVSVALLPELSRLYLSGAARRFRDELVRGAAMTFFLMVPAALAYLVLARPLARAAAYGAMSSHRGLTLVAASIAALALGTLGEAGSVVGTHAAYARQDVRTPFNSMLLRTVVSALGMLGALLFAHGTAVVVVLGLVISAGNILGASYLAAKLRSCLPVTPERLLPSLGRAVVAAGLMLVPSYLIATYVPMAIHVPGIQLGGLLLAAVVGIVVFVAVQRAWHSPELAALQAGVRQLRSRTVG